MEQADVFELYLQQLNMVGRAVVHDQTGCAIIHFKGERQGILTAISDGAAIAREISDVTIAADDLTQLIALRQIAQAMVARVGSNYQVITSFNGSLVFLCAAGILLATTSALLHNASTLAVSLRSMTDLVGKHKLEKPN